MYQPDNEQIVHDLAFGRFIHLLVSKYRDVELTDGQLYRIYESVFSSDLEEVVSTGASEDLPF